MSKVIDGQFQGLVQDLKHWLRSGLRSEVDSIYLYGSIVNGDVRPHYSDVNLLVVTHSQNRQQQQMIERNIQHQFAKQYSYFYRLDLRFIQREEALSLNNIFSWGFLLKQCCHCIYGEDLANSFGEFVPSWEVSKFWNWDFEQDVAQLRKEYLLASQRQGGALVVRQLQYRIAQRLIRAHYGLVLHKEKKWLNTPKSMLPILKQHYPAKQVELERLEILLSDRIISARSVLGLVDHSVVWLSKAYKAQEFRIG